MISYIFWQTASFVGLFFMIYGALLFFLPMIKGRKQPMDDSNMWNCIMAPWYTAAYPHVFGRIRFFQNDVTENMIAVEQAFRDQLMPEMASKPQFIDCRKCKAVVMSALGENVVEKCPYCKEPLIG